VDGSSTNAFIGRRHGLLGAIVEVPVLRIAARLVNQGARK
jgi:hypothetical protein